MKNKFILLMLFLTCCLAQVHSQDWNEIIKVVASDREASDAFGNSVAVSGDYAVVGANNEDHDVNGENTANNAGSAYIFKRDGDIWVQQQKIVASDRAATDLFGYSVAIDGDYIIVGAYNEDEDASGVNTLNNAGSAYIFKRDGDVWVQQQKIVASDRAATDNFGFSVAIKGNYAVIGSLADDEDANGGNTLSNSGSAYVFKYDGSVWTQQQKIVASDRSASANFGSSVSLDGDRILVGARSEPKDANGENGFSNAGAAYVFIKQGDNWVQEQKIVASDREGGDYFAFSVAIDGNYIIAGARSETGDINGENPIANAGSAYFFKFDGSTWLQQQKVVSTNRVETGFFGISVAIDGDYALVGASREENDSNEENPIFGAGAAHIFRKDGDVWTQQKIAASDREQSAYFGISVALDGDYAFVGANRESKDANGENPVSIAGAAYMYEVCFISAPAIETAMEICSGETATLSVTDEEGIVVNWYSSAEATEPVFTGVSFETPELTQTTSYWVEAKSSIVCISDRVEVVITVNPLPELNVITESATICEVTSTTLLAVSEGNTVNWFSSIDATEPIHIGNQYETPVLNETTSYWVEAVSSFGCGVTEREEIVVTVNPLPELTTEIETAVCYGTSAELHAVSEGNIIFWYESADAVEYLVHGDEFITPELTETTSYWVNAYNTLTGCFSDSIEVVITVNPIPETPVAVEVQYFEEGATLADIEVEYTGDLTWYADVYLTIELPETTLIVENTTYYATQTIGGCESEAVIINPQFLGLSDADDNGFAVYPNPTGGIIKIQSNTEVSNIEVFSISGQKAASAKATNEVNIAGYPNGTYIVRITLENGEVLTKKVIKR